MMITVCLCYARTHAAQALGFKKSPLAYLELKARKMLIPSAVTRGVSYASAGAGILDSTVSSDPCVMCAYTCSSSSSCTI